MTTSRETKRQWLQIQNHLCVPSGRKLIVWFPDKCNDYKIYCFFIASHCAKSFAKLIQTSFDVLSSYRFYVLPASPSAATQLTLNQLLHHLCHTDTRPSCPPAPFIKKSALKKKQLPLSMFDQMSRIVEPFLIVLRSH